MKKTLVAIICLVLGAVSLNAQNEIDALRYSRLNPSGTARYMALGGAFGALGGDFTTLSHNPAGIGLYKSSEVSFTPSLYIGQTEATYLGNLNGDERYNFNLGNAGIIMVSDPTSKNPDTKWKNIQFGFGVNRLANFNTRVIVDGFNETSSYLTPYLDASQGVAPANLDNFSTGLAYDANLLFDENEDGVYEIDLPFGGVSQRKVMESKGSINEMVFSMGANYDDRLYLGATIGVPSLKYNETSIYTETDDENNSDYFHSFTRTDELKTSGTGVNFKIGLIVRAADWLRLGGAIETPTFYSGLTDTYSTTFRGVFDTAASTRVSADGIFEYSLNTPFKATAGIGFIIGKSGLLSADYELMDYSNAKLRSGVYDFQDENNAIQDGYLQAHNLRLGAEWRYDALSFRGGYGISANPYRYGTNSAMSTYSAGIGVRDKNFFIDLTYVLTNMDDEYYLYSAPTDADPAIAATTVKNSMFLLTLGFRY